MAIDLIQSVLPDAGCSWRRVDPRVADPKIVVTDERTGAVVAECRQFDLSDDYRGPGVEHLLRKMEALKQQRK